MQFTPIKTDKVLPGTCNIYELLDSALPELAENQIVVITSKIVALCENRVVHQSKGNEEALVAQESDVYFPYTVNDYPLYLTITYHTLLLTAGVDSSNGNDHFVLLPENAQESANAIRRYLIKRFAVQRAGVIITDSTSQPLRRGTIGVALAHSGFLGLHSYIGTPDLFGHPLKVSRSNITGGLAAGAVVAMGEGAEQTPVCIIADMPFVTFQERDPTAEELEDLYVKPGDDLFAPLLQAIDWKPGENPPRQRDSQ